MNNNYTPGYPNYQQPARNANPKEAKKGEAIENIKNAISELDFKNIRQAEEFLMKAINILNEIK